MPDHDLRRGASAQCPHSDLHFNLNNACMGDTNLHYLEISGYCKICEKKLAFRGPMGMSPTEPRINPDGSEIRLPFLGEGEELIGKNFGFNIQERS